MKISRKAQKYFLELAGLSLAILIVLFFYTRAERTLYYWDFGDYQSTLSDLHGSILNPTGRYFSSLLKIQKSEYPLNWALLFPFIPHGYFAHRIFFTGYLGICGLIPGAYASKIICNKILKNVKWGNIAFVIFLLSPGPWMLVLRGWPDVIALGLIWLGFAIAFKPTKVSNYWLGIFMIAYGAIMRKTVILLALVLVLFLATHLFTRRKKYNALFLPRKSLVITAVGLVITVLLTPGTYLTVFNRNNSQFYRPFFVTWNQYFNNLFSINGSIQVIGAIFLPILLLILRKMRRDIEIKWKIIFMIFLIPILQMTLWMTLLSQATDHHMVQWVPIYFSISMAVLSAIIHQIYSNRYSRIAVGSATLIVLLNLVVFLITICAVITPFANPRYSFERPIGRSLAPLERPDYDSLVNLGTTLKNLTVKNELNLAVLNESHEMNSGIARSLKRKYNLSNLDFATLGALDYRDDLGLNQLLNAGLFLIPNKMIVLIPGFQTNLSIMANNIGVYAHHHPDLFTPIGTYLFGAPKSINSWWNNEYIKSSSTFTLYKLNRPLTAGEKIQLSGTISNDILRGSHYAGSFVLAIAPDSGFGPSATNGDKIDVSISDPNFAGVMTKSKSFIINSTCDFELKELSGEIIKGTIGKNRINIGANSQNYITIKNGSMFTSKLCNYQLLPY
jgi:hypothetical protein